MSIFTHLQEGDDTIGWCHYTEDTGKDMVEDAEDLPNKIGELRKYFSKVPLWRGGGRIYLDLKMAHTATFKELEEESRWILKKHKQAAYVKHLQRAVTEQIFWTDGMPDNMDLQDF